MYRKWATIWSDTEEITKVIQATSSKLKKLRQEFNAGQAMVKLPFLEYSTGKVELEHLDFEVETEIFNTLESQNRLQIVELVNNMENFKPFVALLEGEFLSTMHLPDMLRAEWTFLRDNNFLSENYIAEINELLNLADWQLVEKYEKAFVQVSPTNIVNTLHDKFRKEAELKNKAVGQLINNHIAKEKPMLIGNFKGEDHLVYNIEEPAQAPLVYVPIEAKKDMPNAFTFYGRAIGVVNFSPNPPMEGMPTLIFRATMLQMPIT